MFAVIEPGSPAWQELLAAVEQGRKVSVSANGRNTSDERAYSVSLKAGEGMWTPPIRGNAR